MELPILQLSFRDVPPPRQAELEERVRRRAEKLERFCDHITSCRVAIERRGVRIDLTVPPGHELVVRKEPGDNDGQSDLLTVVNGAFEAAERQLKALVEKQRGEVKTHDEPLALVSRLLRDAGYGFLKTVDGRDVYFHRNSVVGDWERLELGMQVRFAESMGEIGPQATTVQVVDKRGASAPRTDERTVESPLGWDGRQR